MCQPLTVRTRGRPPLLADEIILAAALSAFAASGYEAMSVRALNAELGLSHETISKRFGPKRDLFRAAVRFGVGRFVVDLDAERAESIDGGDLERLRGIVRAFMLTTSHHPALGQLLHHEGLDDTERAILLDESGLGDRLTEVAGLLDRLHASGVIRRTHLRELWFLAQGAVAPLHFPGLSTMFDRFDGPVDADEVIDRMTDTIMRGLTVDDGHGA